MRTVATTVRGTYMKKWLLLVGAIVSEVTASLALKAALDNPAWFVLVVAGYVVSFVFLALVLRAGVALGVAYGIWGAFGVASTAVMSAVFFGEPLTPVMVSGLLLIMAGVLCVEMGSQLASKKEATA